MEKMEDFVPTRGVRLALRVCTIFLAFLLDFSLCGANAAGDAASWTTGGPCGSYINSLAMAETNPDIIYAGTDSGVFKTVDGGNTWTRTGIPEILVVVVQVAPDNSDILYAGTEDGIYKSEDGGNTWTQKGLAGARVNAIAIDPLNPDILYAGTGRPRLVSTVGVFKSMDGGETWQEKLSEKEHSGVMALLIDTENSSYIYAGVEDGWAGLHMSTDGGDTWASPSPVSYSYPVLGLAMTPAGFSPACIFAVVEYPFGHDDVYATADRFETWVSLGAPAIPHNPPYALALDPSDPFTHYLGAGGSLYKSPSGSDTWLKKANGLPPGCPSSIVVDPRNGDVLYASFSEGGIYKSTDGAESWNISSQGICETYIDGLAVDPTSSDTVFATVKGIGLAKTTTGGASWDYLVGSPTKPTKREAVAIDPQNPSTIWVGDGYHKWGSFYVYKSADGGQNWTSISFVQYVPDWVYTGVTDILIKADDSDSLLVSMHRLAGILVRTTDGGEHWEKVGEYATALAADPNNPSVAYYGKTRLGYVFRSSVFGANYNWTIISPAGGIGGVRDIEVDSDSKVYVAASDGLWRWDGSNWINFDSLPDDITALAIDRSTSPGIVYVGTGEDGVFVSRDGGNTWTTFNEGLERLSVTKLAISASQQKILYAGIRYGGVWSTALDFVELIGDFCGANFDPPDGYVDVWDLMQFAEHWHTSAGDSNWDSKFDLAGPNFSAPDGYIDVWDLMVFADHWHEGVKP